MPIQKTVDDVQKRDTITTSLLGGMVEPKCLACDRCVFPKDPATLLTETSTTKLSNWIATRRPAIKASVQQAECQWICNTPDQSHNLVSTRKSHDRASASSVDQGSTQLLHDACNKKNE